MTTFTISPEVQKILNKLPDGHIVGGFVRDSIMGRTPKDIDMTTSVIPSKIKKLFPKNISLGEKFGTIIIQTKTLEIEVTTMRSDLTSGRHPKVSFTKDILKDLSRRDFTMNAMALDSNLTLLDPFNAQADIKDKIIKAVGIPIIRLSEDPLRAIRAIRFSSQLNFQISTPLKEAIKKTSLCGISPNRTRDEFLRSLQYNPVKTVSGLIELNLIRFIDPAIPLLQNCQHSPIHHPEGNALNHTYQALTYPDTTPIQKVAILLHDIGKTKSNTIGYYQNHYPGHAKEGVKHTKKTLKALKFSNKNIEEILFAIENHMKMHNIQEMRKTKRHKLYSNPFFKTLLIVHKADVYKRNEGSSNFINEDMSQFILNDIPKNIPTPLINGHYLLSIGFQPSKELRKVKEKLYELQIEQNYTLSQLKQEALTLLEKI